MPGNYQMYHRPEKIGENSTVSIDQIQSSGMFPSDILDDPQKYFADYPLSTETETVISLLKKVQGKPDADVKIYRGTPQPELNPGDWVSLSKEYSAHRYAKPYSENPRSELFEFTVKASQISFTGKSLFENGYFGERKEPNFTAKQKAKFEFGQYRRSAQNPVREASIQASREKINKIIIK